MARSLKRAAKYRAPSGEGEFVITLRAQPDGTGMIGVRQKYQREASQHEVTFGQLHNHSRAAGRGASAPAAQAPGVLRWPRRWR
jgi:hypothetical protein